MDKPRDKFGWVIGVGSFFLYPVTCGRSAFLRVGIVKDIQVTRKTYGDPEQVVVVRGLNDTWDHKPVELLKTDGRIGCYGRGVVVQAESIPSAHRDLLLEHFSTGADANV